MRVSRDKIEPDIASCLHNLSYAGRVTHDHWIAFESYLFVMLEAAEMLPWSPPQTGPFTRLRNFHDQDFHLAENHFYHVLYDQSPT